VPSKTADGGQMKKFSFRSFMIFVMCLIVSVLLIGLGIAGVIKFKHRYFEQLGKPMAATIANVR